MEAIYRCSIASMLRKCASNANTEPSCKPPVPSYEQKVGVLRAQASEPVYERSSHRNRGPHADALEVQEAARTMTGDRIHGHTRSGAPITDSEIEVLAAAAEGGYDVDRLIARRHKRGRPALGSSTASVESVRLDPSCDPSC